MHDYLLQNKEVYDYLGDVEKIARYIKKNGRAAEYSYLKLASECFQTSIHLYRDRFSTDAKPEVFDNDSGPKSNNPVRILFTGSFRYGHFQSIVPQEPATETSESASQVSEEMDVEEDHLSEEGSEFDDTAMEV